jgi:hypothetical protein
MTSIAWIKRDLFGDGSRRILLAALSAMLIGGYSSQWPNVPAPFAVALAVVGAIAVLSPMRSIRIVGSVGAAFSGLLLAIIGLLVENQLLLMVPSGAASVIQCVAVWREATSSGADWRHRLLATLVAAAALLVFYQVLTHIGGEGGL